MSLTTTRAPARQPSPPRSGAAFQQAAGIQNLTWSTPPYLEIGIASLAALALLLPRLRRADSAGVGDVGVSVR